MQKRESRLLHWNGWSDFLGAPNQIDSKYLPYKDVQRIVKKYKVSTVKGWKDLLKRKIIKGGLPSHPNNANKGKGWISWADFFGTSNFRKVEYIYIGYV